MAKQPPKLNLRKVFNIMKKKGGGQVDICLDKDRFYLTDGAVIIKGEAKNLYQLPLDVPSIKAGKNFVYSPDDKKFILNDAVSSSKEDFEQDTNFEQMDGYEAVSFATINGGTIYVAGTGSHVPFCMIFLNKQVILLDSDYIDAIKENMIAEILAKSEKDPVILNTIVGDTISLMPVERTFDIQLDVKAKE
jgi:hypothetical protein